MLSVKGIYENGQVRLLEPMPGNIKAKVIVTILEEIPVPEKKHEVKAGAEAFKDLIGVISFREDSSTQHDRYIYKRDDE